MLKVEVVISEEAELLAAFTFISSISYIIVFSYRLVPNVWKKMVIGHLTILKTTKNKFHRKTIFVNIQNHEELAINSNSAQFFYYNWHI